MRRQQIEANNFRLRSIDRARSQLTYPNVIDNFFRSPSIDEKWRQSAQERQQKIRSLSSQLAAAKAKIDAILAGWPVDWNGSVRKPGTEIDYPVFSQSVARGGKEWPVIDPYDLKGGKPEPESERAGIDRIEVPSPRVGVSPEQEKSAWLKGTYFGTGFGEEAAKWYADRYAASDKWYDRARYGAGGLFSSLWTPDTWKETALTLGPEAVFAAGKLLASANIFRGGAALTPRAKLAASLEHIAPKAGGGIGAEAKVLRATSQNPDILFFHQAKEGGKFGQMSAAKLEEIANLDYARKFKLPGAFKKYSYLEPDMAKQFPGQPSVLEHADALQAAAKRNNISFEIMGSEAETALGKARRANPYLREHLPEFRQDKWYWKGSDLDIRFDKANFEKFSQLKLSEKIRVTREIRDAATGGRKVRVDIKGYTERYLESGTEGLPRFCVSPSGCGYTPGWGAPGWKPNYYGNEALWGKIPPPYLN